MVEVPVPASLEVIARTVRATVPGIELPIGELVAFLQTRVDRGVEAADLARNGADLALAFAVGRGEPAALRELERRGIAPLATALRRMRLDDDEIDEATQVVRQRLMIVSAAAPATIDGYLGTGPLDAWIRVIAAREALTLRRRRAREQPLDDGRLVDRVFSGAGAGPDSERVAMAAELRESLKAAFAIAVAATPARDRSVLAYYYVDELGLDEIAAVYRVHRATAARWIAKARDAVMARTLRSVKVKLQLSAAELDSAIRLCQSSLDLSMPRILRGG